MKEKKESDIQTAGENISTSKLGILIIIKN